MALNDTFTSHCIYVLSIRTQRWNILLLTRHITFSMEKLVRRDTELNKSPLRSGIYPTTQLSGIHPEEVKAGIGRGVCSPKSRTPFFLMSLNCIFNTSYLSQNNQIGLIICHKGVWGRYFNIENTTQAISHYHPPGAQIYFSGLLPSVYNLWVCTSSPTH